MMWTESDNFFRYVAKFFNLYKRYHVLLDTESVFLRYFVIGKHMTVADFNNLPREICKWQLNMGVFGRIHEALAHEPKVMYE